MDGSYDGVVRSRNGFDFFLLTQNEPDVGQEAATEHFRNGDDDDIILLGDRKDRKLESCPFRYQPQDARIDIQSFEVNHKLLPSPSERSH